MGTATETKRDDAAREHMAEVWAAVAPAWRANADMIDERMAAGTAAMLDAAGLRPGARVLELACGPGGAGLAAARRVGPDGHVVLSDVAPAMARIAAERARAAGLSNVEARVLELERIDSPGAAYDAVLCREGLMFAVDPAGALAEIRRVLRPGGRAALSVWGPRERNPWLGLVLDAVSEVLGRPMPPPCAPGVFALDDPVYLEALMSGVGFTEVAVTEHSAPMRAPSFEAWWERTTALAGPLARVLANLPEKARAAIEGRLRGSAAPFTTPEGLEFPGLTLLAAGRA